MANVNSIGLNLYFTNSNINNIMKAYVKYIIIIPVCFFAGFLLGYFNTDNFAELEEANNFKRRVIQSQSRVIDQAEFLLNKHEIWDKDGSDDMVLYNQYYDSLDSLLNTQL